MIRPLAFSPTLEEQGVSATVADLAGHALSVGGLPLDIPLSHASAGLARASLPTRPPSEVQQDIETVLGGRPWPRSRSQALDLVDRGGKCKRGFLPRLRLFSLRRRTQAYRPSSGLARSASSNADWPSCGR